MKSSEVTNVLAQHHKLAGDSGLKSSGDFKGFVVLKQASICVSGRDEPQDVTN